jgi:phage-related baseplate assembly protein
MTRFTQIDLSGLPAPEAVEALSFEAIVEALRSDYLERYPEGAAVYLESDPAAKLIETAAYRELTLRRRVNDAVHSVLLAKSWGTNLDHLGADKLTARKLIDPGDPDAVPPILPVWEKDDDFRARIQLSWEALSTAGPAGAYRYHALAAHGSVREVSVQEPEPVAILVTVQTIDNDGIASAEVLDAVSAALSHNRTVRPLSDQVTVQAASALPFDVTATLWIEDGPDPAVVLAAADAALQTYLAKRGILGMPNTRSGLSAALSVAGVWKVDLTEPAADVEPTPAQFAVPGTVTLTQGGAA